VKIYGVTSIDSTPWDEAGLSDAERRAWEKYGLLIHWYACRRENDWGDLTKDIQHYKKYYRAYEIMDGINRYEEYERTAGEVVELKTYSETAIDEYFTRDEARRVASVLEQFYTGVIPKIHEIRLSEEPNELFMSFGSFGSSSSTGIVTLDTSGVGLRYKVKGWYNLERCLTENEII